MSYLIVIHGSLGSGKSTIAKELADTLGAVRVQIDDVLSEHKLDTHDDREASIPVSKFITALNFTLPNIRTELDNGRIVIFDGCFYHKEAMDYLLKNLNAPYYLFTLKAPLAVCIERDKNRLKPIGEDVAKEVYALTSQLDFGETIDATKPMTESVAKILSYLPTK